VSTAATPGIWRAASTLIAMMRACACGETNHDAMKRVWAHEIGDVAPASPHEALVFKAVDAAPQ
jgi:hypothetical protein